MSVTGATRIQPRALKGLRIGIPKQHFWASRGSATSPPFAWLLWTCSDGKGRKLVDVDVQELLAPHAASHMEIPLFEGKVALTAFLEEHAIPLTFADVVEQVDSPDVRQFLEAQLDPTTAVSRKAYIEALEIFRPALIAAYDYLFAGNKIDVLAFPTCGVSAPLFSESEFLKIGDETFPTFPALTHNTDVGSNAGIPGLSVPAGLTSAGLPVGLGLDAARGRDEDLLGLALALGHYVPGFRSVFDVRDLRPKKRENPVYRARIAEVAPFSSGHALGCLRSVRIGLA